MKQFLKELWTKWDALSFGKRGGILGVALLFIFLMETNENGALSATNEAITTKDKVIKKQAHQTAIAYIDLHIPVNNQNLEEGGDAAIMAYQKIYLEVFNSIEREASIYLQARREKRTYQKAMKESMSMMEIKQYALARNEARVRVVRAPKLIYREALAIDRAEVKWEQLSNMAISTSLFFLFLLLLIFTGGVLSYLDTSKVTFNLFTQKTLSRFKRKNIRHSFSTFRKNRLDLFKLLLPKQKLAIALSDLYDQKEQLEAAGKTRRAIQLRLGLEKWGIIGYHYLGLLQKKLSKERKINQDQ